MDTDELLNKLRGWANAAPALFLNEFEPLYKNILRKDLPRCKCPDKIRDAVIELYSFIKRNYNNMDKITGNKARLRVGCVLYHVNGYNGIFTNANITDDVARAFIAQRPNKINWFETLPDMDVAEKIPEAQEPAQEKEPAQVAAPKKRGRKAKK